MSAPVVALVPVLALVALLLLGYREICLRVGRLAARILLLSSHPAASTNNPAYSLPAVHLLQTMLCLAVTALQLANNELRAAACYLLLVKAALIRRPAAWLPHGLVDLLSIASLTWLAFGHLFGEQAAATESVGLLAASEVMLTHLRDLVMQDRLELWLAAAAVFYLLGCLCLIGWVMCRGVQSVCNRCPSAIGIGISLLLLLITLYSANLTQRTYQQHHGSVETTAGKDYRTTAVQQRDITLLMAPTVSTSTSPVCAVQKVQSDVCKPQHRHPASLPAALIPTVHFYSTLSYSAPGFTAIKNVVLDVLQCRVSPHRACPLRDIERPSRSSSRLYSLLHRLYSYIVALLPRSFLQHLYWTNL